MVSNQVKMARGPRHLIFLLLLQISTINGQSISKYYTSSFQENGMLYFILPQSGFNNNKIHSKFIYDITYSTINDTAKLNFSYYDKSDRTIDSIVLVSGKQRFASRVKKIFIETKKTKWHYRYSASILFPDLKTFFAKENSPEIILFTQQGTVALKIKTKKWRRESAIIRKILILITYN